MLQIGRLLLQVLDQAVVHRWNAEEHSAVALQLGDDRLRAEWDQCHRSPRHHGPVKCNAQAVHVEERQRMHKPIATLPSPRFDDSAHLGEHVAMVEQCPLRLACGS